MSTGIEPIRVGSSSVHVLGARPTDLTARARAAAQMAREQASAVDAEGRFPKEAFAEIRKQRLLGIMVPQALDGDGASLAEIIDVCYILGQACASTGLIFAMHQIKMACIVRHTKGNAALESILRRIATEQLLMASSTTEGQAGGRARRALEAEGAAVEADAAMAPRQPRAQSDRHLLCGGSGRYRDDGTPRGRCGSVRSSLAGAAQGRLHARETADLGHARHAWHA